MRPSAGVATVQGTRVRSQSCAVTSHEHARPGDALRFFRRAPDVLRHMLLRRAYMRGRYLHAAARGGHAAGRTSRGMVREASGTLGFRSRHVIAAASGWRPMKTASDPSTDAIERVGSSDSCPRCGRGDHREHLLQTSGVVFYRCGACGHMFIVRTSPRETEPSA